MELIKTIYISVVDLEEVQDVLDKNKCAYSKYAVKEKTSIFNEISAVYDIDLLNTISESEFITEREEIEILATDNGIGVTNILFYTFNKEK